MTNQSFKSIAPPVARFSRFADLVEFGQRKSSLKAERWITINSDGEGGGTHVKIDDKGNITAGPAGLASRGVRNLSDFGKGKEGGNKDPKRSDDTKEESPQDRAERRIYEDNIRAVYRNAGDASIAHGDESTARRIAEVADAKLVNAGEMFEKDFRDVVEKAGANWDVAKDAVETGEHRDKVRVLAERAWAKTSEKLNSDKDKLVIHGLDDMPKYGMEHALNSLHGIQSRGNDRQHESAIIVTAKNSELDRPQGRRPLEQESGSKENWSKLQDSISSQAREKEEAERPAKERASREQAESQRQQQMESDRKRTESQAAEKQRQDKLNKFAEQMKPTKELPKKLTKGVLAEIENAIAISTGERNPDRLKIAVDHWVSSHAPDVPRYRPKNTKSFNPSQARADDGKWTSEGGGGAGPGSDRGDNSSGGSGDSKPPGKIMAKHSATVTQRAHEATQAATGGRGPLAKATESTHGNVSKRGHDAKDSDHKRTANAHAAHARTHEEIAKTTKDPKAKEAHYRAAQLHRAAERAHNNTARRKLDEQIGGDF